MSSRPAPILVGYDGSPESKHALGVARKLAAMQHTRLSAFETVAFPAFLFTFALEPPLPVPNG